MANGTVTRADLTDAIYRSLGMSRNESAMFVERIVEEICSSLERGETVKISSFGTFTVRDKKMRMGRNPKTGQEVPITPRRVISFRASNVLKDQINQGLTDRSAHQAAE